MPMRTIDFDGNDERRPHPANRPVEYVVTLSVKLTADQAAEFQDCEDVIVRYSTKLARARVITSEVQP